MKQASAIVIATLLAAMAASAQGSAQTTMRYVAADPSGTCGTANYITVNRTTGTMRGCIAGSWATLGGGASMVYPGAGIADSTGAAWATSYSPVTSVGSPGSDTSLPTEKAVRSALPAGGITQLTGDVTAGPGSGSQGALVSSAITSASSSGNVFFHAGNPNISTGTNNTAMGSGTLTSVTDGAGIVAIGYGVAANVYHDYDSVYIGTNSGDGDAPNIHQRLVAVGAFSAAAADYATAIGSGAVANARLSNAIGHGAVADAQNSVALNVACEIADTTCTRAGVQLGGTVAQPSCDAAHRGTIWYVAGGTSVADTLAICAKSASDTYSWLAVVTP